MTRFWGAVLLGASAVLLGCQTTSERMELAEELTLPEKWSSHVTSAVIAGEPEITSAEPWLAAFESEELNLLVEHALENNPDLEITAARLRANLAEARSERGRRLPSLRAEVGGSRQQINTFGPATFGGARFENYSADLVLNWEVDLWGRLASGQRAALGQAAATAADLDGARLSLAVEVARAWFEWTSASSVSQLIAERERSLSLNRDFLSERFSEGLADGRALAFLDAELANLEAERIRSNSRMSSAERRLNRLVGNVTDELAKDFSSAQLPSLPPRPPAGVPSDLLQRRPDVVASNLRYEAALASLESAERARWPVLSLTASGGTASQALSDLIDSDFSVWRIAGSVAQPIFEGGRIRAGIDRAAAQAEAEFAQYRSTVLDAFIEVEEALSLGDFLRAEASAIERAVEASANAREVSWERYLDGTGELLEALDAERSLLAFRERQLLLKNEALQNHLQLVLALGGDWANLAEAESQQP